MLTSKFPRTDINSATKQATLKIICYSVVPSPYQRDLFYALSCLPGISLSVFYLEAAVSDSPWPEKALQPYERVMPGFCPNWDSSRFHLNWHLPQINGVDAIIINGYQNSTAQLLLRAYSKKIPCFFWGEKMLASSSGFKGYLQKALAKGLENCTGIAAIGSAAMQDYRLRFPHKPVSNIPYYCDLTPFSQDLPVRPRTPVTLFFCGQMIVRKGIDLLLDAFTQLLAAGYSARLLLVGREAELPQLLNALPKSVQQHIEYAGFQSPEALPYFFQQADIFVLPSRYDGWGVVVNQALGAGLPIVCSDSVGAAHDLVEPSVNGDAFPANSTQALFEVLKSYLSNPASIQQAGRASLAKSQQWSPAVGAERWLEFLREQIL